MTASERAMLAGAALFAALLAAACRPGRPGWQTVDLTRERPTFESYPPRGAPATAPVAYLGSEEVRDMSLVPASQLGVFGRRTAGQIRALEQSAGATLAWDLRLGESPYLSFIPLGCRRPCTQRVLLHDARGVEHELYAAPAARPRTFAPAAVEIDLQAYAGQRTRLLLAVEPAAAAGRRAQVPPRALWGSPALYSRRPLAPRPRRRGGRPSILLIGVDTLRADAVGERAGGALSLTPAIDRLASRADVWLDAYTCFNVTNPSFASLLTGLYGKNHGVYDLQTRLPAAHDTLAEILGRAGYRSLAVVSAHHLGDHNSGLGQGFDEVLLAGEHFAAELGTAAAAEWIDRTPSPFFVWLHLFDPHTPHTPPDPYALGERPAAPFGMGRVTSWLPFRALGRRQFSQPVLGAERDLYDGEIAYVDHELDRLLALLADRGLEEETVVALVGDHGENLGEHGIAFRHVGLYETTLRVPLILRRPGEPGRRRSGLVQTIDLFPTLLRAAGVEAPPVDGLDLDGLTAPGRSGRRAVFAEQAGGTGAMVRSGQWKYIVSRGGAPIPDGAYLYDLASDPGELHNLAGTGLEVEEELATLLHAWRADRRPAARAVPHRLSPEEVERLRALGYLQ